MAVMLVLARYFVDLGVKAGPEQIRLVTRLLLRWCLRASPAFLAVGGLFATAAPWLGPQSWPVILLIPITALAITATEILRVALQSMLLFLRAGALWITSTASQCLFSLIALATFATVWAGVAGILVGSAFATIIFLPWITDVASERHTVATNMLPRLKEEAPLVVSYSLFVLLANVDVLLGYLVLPRSELNIYAASAFLPKALVTATFAVAQVLVPVVTQQRTSGFPFRRSIAKGIAVTSVLAVMGFCVLWFAAPLIQRTAFAVHGLNVELMGILAVAAVALSVLRILVVIEVALQRCLIGLAQAPAVILLALLTLLSQVDPRKLALFYALISSGLLLIVAIGIVLMNRDALSLRPFGLRTVKSTSEDSV